MFHARQMHASMSRSPPFAAPIHTVEEMRPVPLQVPTVLQADIAIADSGYLPFPVLRETRDPQSRLNPKKMLKRGFANLVLIADFHSGYSIADHRHYQTNNLNNVLMPLYSPFFHFEM